MLEPEVEGSNPTANPHLNDVVAARVSRRAVLGGTVGAAALTLFGAGFASPATAAPGKGKGGRAPLLGFTAVPVSTADAIVVPPGYTAQVLIPWGTPLRSSGPAWKKDASNTAAEQAKQVGMHHDGMHFFPLGRGKEQNERGLLVLNHEYTNQTLLFPDGDAVMTPEKVQKSLNAHGVTVIEVRKVGGAWTQVDSRFNRRITGSTPVAFSGPVGLDHPMLASSSTTARGTLNNCSHGYTPWGTYLACEENFNGYFGTTRTGWAPSAHEARYGLNAAGFGYKWHPVDPRFDLAVNPGEPNRFGWVVEIDPFSPGSTPVKRTALGRIKHESATVTESRGKVVVYTGDDENKDYVYKFVGSDSWRSLIARGKDPLDHGTLYVGRFLDDGTGQWLPLVHGEGALTVANGFADQADVLIRTRQSADAVQATRLDRAEWVTVDERSRQVYLTLTNGSTGVGAINPRNPNPYGSIVTWREKGGHFDALTFEWDIFVLAGDPTKDARVDIDGDAFGSPDGIWADADSRIWIQTDVSNGAQRRTDYEDLGNNQMLVADPETREIKRFLVGPNGAEVTGVITTPDQRTMFVNIQHPGEATTAIGTPTPANPRAVSNWPDFDAAGRPRPATIVITKDDGGVIGT